MSTVTTVERMTADEFLALGLREDGRRGQLVDGEVVMNEPTWTHNQAQIAIVFALRAWSVAEQARGTTGLPLDVKFDERNVYAPDVVWYRDGRAPAVTDQPPYPVPDLAVEVRSPSTWRFDVGVKKRNYERRGVAELWLVDTAADVVLVFRRSSAKAPAFDVSEELDAATTLTSPLLPGFALPVAEIFGD
ncbi:Uma2 family endonuclease [soil metagenome]|jgi:Uma2 family endonuclease